uniref:GTP 3',8-cyclase MoaA n=1 Tax=uncultured Sphingomonas sp. TaxID=158754 RepID=UPI0025E9A0CA|nr:GTP 3',8-cyclase MoaA [uncultured Sphingomonas sp.]
MIDPFGRSISYLRLSVTDRCDLRCTYCMPERMRFLPRADLLTLEELDELASAFIAKGVTKLRLTGGEPLVRKDIMRLIDGLSRHLRSGALEELTLTTNGTRLAQHAADLARAGVKRVNVSLDSLNPETYARITRGGRLAEVIAGIDAAIAAGIRVKLNSVALLHDNLMELPDIAAWAHDRGADFTVIEVMPLGSVEADRIDQYVPLTEVRRRFEQRWTLTDVALRTGGPARYARTSDGGLIGFITPLSHNFCGSCNRVRVTCTGKLFLCLGNAHEADLGALLRSGDQEALSRGIDRAIGIKPERHHFAIRERGAVALDRHMSVTGG